MDSLKHYVSHLLTDMLSEIKDADKYLHAAEKSENIEHKKKFAEMAHQELLHYDGLCEMMKEKMRTNPNDIMIDNNILAKTLYDNMVEWKESVCEHFKKIADELGIKY